MGVVDSWTKATGNREQGKPKQAGRQADVQKPSKRQAGREEQTGRETYKNQSKREEQRTGKKNREQGTGNREQRTGKETGRKHRMEVWDHTLPQTPS